MRRVVLDLSALILIRQANLLRRLSGDIKAGRIAVAAYGLNNLNKNPRWRDWVARNEERVSVRPQGNDENELFYLLLSRHGSVTSNPFIDSDDLMVIAGRVAKVIDKVRPAKVFLDATGLGAGVYDRLREMKYNQVEGINFAQSPIDDRKWSNKRAEMWGLLGEWLADSAGVDIPDEDDLHSDFCAPVWGKGATKFNSNEQVVLESKAHISERVGFSPDGGDAAGLTFAAPVSSRLEEDRPGRTRLSTGPDAWMAF